MPSPFGRASVVALMAAFLVAGFCSGCGSSSAEKVSMPSALSPPPIAPRKPHSIAVHGRTLVDDYFWLRQRDDPDVMAYLKAEDAYADAMLEPTAGLQRRLYDEMLGHIKQTDETVPYRENGYLYFSRTREGLQYPIYLRRRAAPGAPDEVILDQNELAKGHAYTSLGGRSVSDDGHLLAYSVDYTGYRQFTLRIKDLRTGALLPDALERVDDFVWASDSRTIFFVTEDPVTKRHDKFWRHVVVPGASSASGGGAKPELLYEEKDEAFDLACGRSRDKAVVFLESAAKTSSEVRFLRADRPGDALHLIARREPLHEYDVDHRGDRFYIRTNKGAKNFRVVTAPVADASEAHWTELIAHRPDVKIAGVDLFAGHLVLSEWEGGLQQIEVVDLATLTRSRIQYPEPVYAAALGPNAEFETSALRYEYQSLVTPVSVFEYDMKRGASALLKQTDVPGGYDRANYASERVFAAAPDGTRIPISIAYRRGLEKDGSAPLLLYAYGSYGYSTSPTFAASRLPLLDRGVVYAIAHVRGGGELGEPWREAGRMMHKQNTFDDFIASAEHLVAARFTSPGRLVIQGGSAGGLLVGAVVNRRPDLFNAAIAQVPFVDVVNDMLDATLPLTTSEYTEWGNPKNKDEFDYMLAYSPYENVSRQAYPALLVRTSLNDSQVMYWEGAKFTARLRALKTNDRPLLLKVNFGAGHGGASGRYDALRETALNWAFVLWQSKLPLDYFAVKK